MKHTREKYKHNKKHSVRFYQNKVTQSEPIIVAKVGGTDLNFIVDSGCEMSLLSKSATKQISIDRFKNVTHEIYGCEGKPQDVELCHLKFSIGNVMVDDVFGLCDMESSFKLFEHKTGIPLHGIIGTSFLIPHKSIIDYDSYKFSFDEIPLLKFVEVANPKVKESTVK